MIKSQEQTMHARKTREDFFIKYFTSHFICKVSKRLFQVCVWEGAGDRTLLKYFDPEVMAVSVVSFSFSMVAQPDPEVNSSVCWLSLLQSRLLPSSTVLLALLLAYLPLSSIRRPYITFKLPRSNIDTPQRLRNFFRFPATGMCHFLPVHHLEWHFWPGQKVKT